MPMHHDHLIHQVGKPRVLATAYTMIGAFDKGIGDMRRSSLARYVDDMHDVT